jgi:hypothetical protein
VCIHCFDSSLVSTFTNETQVSSPVTRTVWLRNTSTSLWDHSKKSSKPKPFFAFCTHPRVFSEPILLKTCDSLACDNLTEKNSWNLWKFTSKFWKCEAPSFTNFLVNTLNKIVTHYRRPADHFALHRKHVFHHLWTFYAILLQFIHSLHFGRKPHKFIMDISGNHGLAWRKRTTARISQLVGLPIARHIITHSVEARTNTGWPVYVIVYKAMSHVMLPRMRSYNSCLRKRRLLFE